MSEIEGIDKLVKQLEAIKKTNSNKPLLKGAYVLQKYSMQNAPVKTGFLRNSHESAETTDGAEMRVNANYAFYVEFGTSKWAGKPFVRPAIDEHSKEIIDTVREEFQREINNEVK